MVPGGGSKQSKVQAQLSVRHGRAAVDLYEAAFGAVELFRFGGTESLFWVEDESPDHRSFSPETVGGATARMLLIVDGPVEVVARAVAAGASEVNPASEEHGRELGPTDDSIGHRWEVGRPIGEWPPVA